MIADCEICDRKQVPCKSCQESQRAICYRCDGDVDDPYCEAEWACPECGNTTRSVIQCAIECRDRNEERAKREDGLVTDWEDVEQLTNVIPWCGACQSNHWPDQCDPDLDQQKIAG